MTVKELTLFGKALKALIDVGAMEQVKEIIDYMASEKVTEPVKDQVKE
jgi:hypothetical protein